jgi:hypothetical protein
MPEEGQAVSADQEDLEESAPVELTEREKIIASGGDPDESQHEDESPEVAESEPASEPVSSGDEDPWITDEIRQVAASYGMGDEHLNNLGSEMAFQQAAQVIDSTFANAATDPNFGQQPKAEDSEESGDDPDSETKDQPLGNFDQKIEGLRESGYEDDVLDILKGEHEANEQLKNELASIQLNQQQEAMANHAIDFHDLVDKLDPDLFGVSFEDGDYKALTQEQDDNRRKLWTGMDTIAAGIYQTAARDGVEPQVPEDSVLAERAKMMIFSGEVRDQERQKISRRVQQQSKRRRPVGSASRNEPVAASPSDQQSTEIANHPKLVEFWDKANQ